MSHKLFTWVHDAASPWLGGASHSNHRGPDAMHAHKHLCVKIAWEFVSWLSTPLPHPWQPLWPCKALQCWGEQHSRLRPMQATWLETHQNSSGQDVINTTQSQPHYQDRTGHITTSNQTRTPRASILGCPGGLHIDNI